MTAFPSARFSAAAISLLFACALAYNGIGHSLQWLSLAGVVLLVWLSSSIARQDLARTRLAWGWLPAVALAYAIWLLVNPFLSTYPYASSTTAMQLALLPLALLGWLILSDEDKNTAWRATATMLLLGGVVLALWGILDFLVPPGRSAHGPLIDPNAYGALMNLFLIPAAFGYMRAAPSGRGIENPRLQLAIIGLFALALFMSLSRGGLLSLLAILPLVLWLNRRVPAFRWRAGLMIVVLIAAHLLTKAIPLGASKGLETLLLAPGQQIEQDHSIRARFLMWEGAWRIIAEANPLIGTGLGTYKNYYATYRDTRETMSSGNLAHNDYLQALQEGGLIHVTLFLALTVFAPVVLLYRSARHSKGVGPPDADDGNAGLLLGIMAISLHALVNFTHYVAPIAFLTGLYLARSWEMTRAAHPIRLPFGPEHIKPGFLKALVIALVAVPVGVLGIDGVIFKLFSSKEPLIAHFAPDQRFTIVNTALAIRPDNPRPRTFLIHHLLDGAARTGVPEARERLLAQAETEAKALIRTAPALASGRYLLGRIRALRGTHEELLLARDDLEHAVSLVPPSAGMRLELLRLYRRLGMEHEAHQTIREARKWFMHEIDYGSLAAFAREASQLAAIRQDREEAEFWAWVHGRLTELGLVG